MNFYFAFSICNIHFLGSLVDTMYSYQGDGLIIWKCEEVFVDCPPILQGVLLRQHGTHVEVGPTYL